MSRGDILEGYLIWYGFEKKDDELRHPDQKMVLMVDAGTMAMIVDKIEIVDEDNWFLFNKGNICGVINILGLTTTEVSKDGHLIRLKLFGGFSHDNRELDKEISDYLKG